MPLTSFFSGELQTYWLQIPASSLNGISSDDVQSLDSLPVHSPSTATLSKHLQALPSDEADANKPIATFGQKILPEKACRLVKWNVDILARLLKQIMARRASIRSRKASMSLKTKRAPTVQSSANVIHEVVDVLSLPDFNPKVFEKQVDPDSIVLPMEVTAQLELFVTEIAALYRNNVSLPCSTQ
jgi:hypothetical protein